MRSFLYFGIRIPSTSTSPSDPFIGKLHGNVKVQMFCDPIHDKCTILQLGFNPERLAKLSRSSMWLWRDSNCGFKRKHESSAYNDNFVFKPRISNPLILLLELILKADPTIILRD